MALATPQLQAFHFSPRSFSWSGGNINHSLPAIRPYGRHERFVSLKCRSCSSVGSSLAFGSKPKSFKISAFKGVSRNDDTGDRASGSLAKNPIKVTYFKNESEEACSESSKVQNAVPAPYPVSDDRATRLRAIQDLFKRWLVLLRTSSEPHPVERTIEQPSSIETSEMPKTIHNRERVHLLKSIWCTFLALDAVIKIPLVLFTPMFLAINLIYGSEVSKELIPLWTLGPLIVAFYVKSFQLICNLYAFTFRQTIKVLKNLPVYTTIAYDYVVSGKLKAAIRKHLFQPVVDVKNMDYKEFTLRKLNDLREWLTEKYLDFVESIWPYYCRAIRFLKRANLL